MWGCLAISIVISDPLLYYSNRWGRNQEVASEDPFINGLYGIAYSKGLQNGQDPRYLQAVTTLKHFDACMSHGTASITARPTHPPSTKMRDFVCLVLHVRLIRLPGELWQCHSP